jgi:hypothetical protein
LPRQNRPVVRDGRLQTPKKRTDRSYLGTARPASAPEPEAPAEESAAPHDPGAAFQPPASPASPAAPVAPAAARQPSAVAPLATEHAATARRRRHEVDPEALLTQDSSYAMHELRRIGVLAVMVVATLIALGVFMR